MKPQTEFDQTGSIGFAFSSKITESGNSILYINPHTSFYYRPEIQAVSEEGLNAYTYKIIRFEACTKKRKGIC